MTYSIGGQEGLGQVAWETPWYTVTDPAPAATPVAPGGEALLAPDALQLAPLPAANFEPTPYGWPAGPLLQLPLIAPDAGDRAAPPRPPVAPKAAGQTAAAIKPEGASRAFLARLNRAADQAQAAFNGVGGKCFRTADTIVRRLTGQGIEGVPYSESSIGRPLSHLKTLVDMGKLKPGMVIYVSRQPGADPRSMNRAYGPHWITYLGKDRHNVPRFADQFSTNHTVQTLAELVPGRKIYQVFDPFKNGRG